MLKGKAAVVTGSTSGIRLGIARALAAQRANILLNGFGERLRDTRPDRRSHGLSVLAGSRPDPRHVH
jgi:3-hydroxybutyrate dehydrogenase